MFERLNDQIKLYPDILDNMCMCSLYNLIYNKYYYYKDNK